MNEIALEAGISKSLLFFYFKNKKEFYIFLWSCVRQITIDHLSNSNIYEENDIFEMMYKGLQAKIEMMHKYPDMSNFALKAYYDDDEDIKNELSQIIEPFRQLSTNILIPELDPALFKEGLDLSMMYRDMYLASEGFLYHEMQSKDFSIDKMADDYKKMIDCWRSIYLRNA